MDPIDIAVSELRGFRPFAPHEAILDLRTQSGQDVAIHIPATLLHRLDSDLSAIIERFPPPPDGQ
jgi:hypothetical protein